MEWEIAARTRLDALIADEKVLVRISAAKRLRDGAESAARSDGRECVEIRDVEVAKRGLALGRAA
ncbi:MAG: hypothetical protein KDJ51_16050 [Nitratireductor sp.]|nr:hypothetical protein [Nitratireductor sp.]